MTRNSQNVESSLLRALLACGALVAVVSVMGPAAMAESAVSAATPAAATPVVSDRTSEKTSEKAKMRTIWDDHTGFAVIPAFAMGVSQFDMSGAAGSTAGTSRATFSAGVLVDFGKWLVGETGLLYLPESTNLSINGGSASATVSGTGAMTVTYLAIPLLARVNLFAEPANRLDVTIGVMPAFAMNSDISGTLDVSDDGLPEDTETASSYLGGVRSLNLLGRIGVGGDVAMGLHRDLRIDAFYDRSLLSVMSDGSGTVYSNSFLLSLGFGFDL